MSENEKLAFWLWICVYWSLNTKPKQRCNHFEVTIWWDFQSDFHNGSSGNKESRVKPTKPNMSCPPPHPGIVIIIWNPYKQKSKGDGGYNAHECVLGVCGSKTLSPSIVMGSGVCVCVWQLRWGLAAGSCFARGHIQFRRAALVPNQPVTPSKRVIAHNTHTHT